MPFNVQMPEVVLELVVSYERSKFCTFQVNSTFLGTAFSESKFR